MNKKSISVFFIILFFLTENNFAQSYATIKTPTNTVVEVIISPEFSSAILAQIEAEAADWISDYNSNAVRVAPASGTYNCHNFAWHYSDGGLKKWINQYDRFGAGNVSKYWSGSAPTYQLATSSKASKVFYPNGDHSAIVTSEPGIYESKWGNWPRYRHALSDCPYNSSGVQYYNIPISGSNEICGSETESYSTINISGASYTWSGNKITISGSGSSVNASENGAGSGWIKSEITSPYSGTTIKSYKNPIWVGIQASFSGTGNILYLKTGTYTATASCGFTPYQYDWWYRKEGGRASVLIYTGNPLILQSVPAGSGPPLSVSLQQQAEQQLIKDDLPNQPWQQTEFFLYVRAVDAAGNYYETPEQRFTANGDVDLIPTEIPLPFGPTQIVEPIIKVSPNPATDLLTVTVNNMSFGNGSPPVLKIYSNQYALVKQIPLTGTSTTLNISELKRGLYHVNVQGNDWILKEKFVKR